MIVNWYTEAEFKIRKMIGELKNQDQTKVPCKVECFFDWISSRHKFNHPKSSFAFSFVSIFVFDFFFSNFTEF